jgi:hypothetical protein
MTQYGAFSDDFYLNMNLSTEMELPQGRESVLHYFEQVRRRYPALKHFYSREKKEFVLEEGKESGSYRWVSLEAKRVNSGMVNPTTLDDAAEQHHKVLELVPFELMITPLDCESLSVMLGFDFNCRGNQSEILAEAIGIAPGLEKLAGQTYGQLLSVEPVIQFALDEDWKTQCRVSFETRTSTQPFRTEEMPEEQLSVYLTVRRFGSLCPNETYAEEFDRLLVHCRELVDEYLVTNVLVPLQKAISLR